VDEIIRLLADTAGGEHGGDTAATKERDELSPRRVKEQTTVEVQKTAARKPVRRD